MKKYRFLLFLLFTGCFNNPEGRIVFYDFNAPKFDVEKSLINNFGKRPPCDTCLTLVTISETDGFENIYVDFKNLPKEGYLLGFTCDSVDWKENSNSRLALIGVNYGSGWEFCRDGLSQREKDRIQRRFETEILSQIEYSYRKSNKTGTCAGM